MMSVANAATRAAQTILATVSPSLVVDGHWGTFTQGEFAKAPVDVQALVASVVRAVDPTATPAKLYSTFAAAKMSPQGQAEKQRAIAERGTAMTARQRFTEDVLPLIYRAGYNAGFQNPGLLVAQLVLESGWNAKESGRNNFGGLKATSSQDGTVVQTKEYENGRYVNTTAKFIDFPSVQAFADYYISYLLRRYPETKFSRNADEFARALRVGQLGGYATDVHYASKIGNLLTSASTRTVIANSQARSNLA